MPALGLEAAYHFGAGQLSRGGRLFVDAIDGRYMQLQRGQVVLTIDDGPTSRVTDRISRVLRDRNIRGVFFVVGNRVNSNTSIMRQLQADGHIVANHTWRHELDFPTPEAMIQSLTASLDVIEPYMNPGTRCYFRAPGGVWNNWRKNIANNHERINDCIGPFWWNVGGGSPQYPADWKCWSQGTSARTCAEGYYRELLAKGRGVILMHDINVKSAEMLEHLLGMMDREGIKNSSGGGFWDFIDLDRVTALDQLEDR